MKKGWPIAGVIGSILFYILSYVILEEWPPVFWVKLLILLVGFVISVLLYFLVYFLVVRPILAAVGEALYLKTHGKTAVSQSVYLFLAIMTTAVGCLILALHIYNWGSYSVRRIIGDSLLIVIGICFFGLWWIGTVEKRRELPRYKDEKTPDSRKKEEGLMKIKKDQLPKLSGELSEEAQEIEKMLLKELTSLGNYLGDHSLVSKFLGMRIVTTIKSRERKVIDSHLQSIQSIADLAKGIKDQSQSVEEMDLAIARLRKLEQNIEIDELKRKLEKIKVEVEIAGHQKELDKIERGETEHSPKERFLKSVRDKVEMAKAKGLGIEEIKKSKEEFLSNINQEKDPDLYQKAVNIWDDLIADTMEK